jgi:hypothetical protein
VSACPHCAINLPPRRNLPNFAARVIAERARLAMLDPEGEHDALKAAPRRFDWTAQAFEPERVGWLAGAVAPLDGVRARQIALHFAEQPAHLTIVRDARRDFGRELLDRLGAPADRDHGMLRCPAHEDRAASLSWRFTGDRVLLRCFAGCTFDQIRGAL